MDVARQLREHASAIAVRVTDDVYEDPFWLARYGERGRAFVIEDARHHVDHLARAIEVGDARIMRDYARWLQTVLTTRGMCTRHLDQNFERVGAEVMRVAPAAKAPLATIVAAARDALRYTDDAARRIQEASAAIARKVVDELWLRTGAREDDAARARRHEDALLHLSYLADSVAHRRAELFVEHATFTAEFLRDRGLSVASFEDGLAVLVDVASREPSLAHDDQRHLRERVDRALEALRLSREATA